MPLVILSSTVQQHIIDPEHKLTIATYTCIFPANLQSASPVHRSSPTPQPVCITIVTCNGKGVANSNSLYTVHVNHSD